jgi:hypothetical protein
VTKKSTKKKPARKPVQRKKQTVKKYKAPKKKRTQNRRGGASDNDNKKKYKNAGDELVRFFIDKYSSAARYIRNNFDSSDTDRTKLIHDLDIFSQAHDLLTKMDYDNYTVGDYERIFNHMDLKYRNAVQIITNNVVVNDSPVPFEYPTLDLPASSVASSSSTAPLAIPPAASKPVSLIALGMMDNPRIRRRS